MVQENMLLLYKIFKSECSSGFFFKVLFGIKVLVLTFFKQIQKEYVSSTKRFDKPIFE